MLEVKFLRDDLFRACSGSDHASAVLLAAFPSDRTPVESATVCLVPFLLDPAAALGRPPPLAHEVAMSGSCRGVLAWCVVSDVHPAASVCVSVGKPSPSCLVVRPLVVAPPAVRFCVCPGADRCAYSCFAHVCPCVKGRCDRCPLGSGMISDVFVVCFFCAHFIRTVSPDVPRSRVAWLWSAAKNDVRVRRGGLQPASNFFSASVRLLRPSP